MPDEMKEIPQQPQPPKSTIDEFRQAGPTPEQMKEWQGPEWKSELPDTRMQLDDELLKRLQEREGYERAQQGSEYDKGRSIEAVIARHPNPETVRTVLRALQLKEETFNTNGEPDNRYEISHRVSTLGDRAIALGIPIADVFRLDLAEKLSEDETKAVRAQRGSSLPKDFAWHNLVKTKHIEGFGTDSYTISLPMLVGYKTDKEGNRAGQEFKMLPETLVYLGKDDKEREGKSKEFDKLRDEVTARHLMMEMWGHHVTYYYALNKLVEGHYFGTTLSSEGLGVLFNLTSQEGAVKETATGVPLRSLGDKIETAMRLYYVAALCEKPDRFEKELVESPGWEKYLFLPGTDPSVIEEWIGKPNEWELETQAGGHRDKDTLRQERLDGKRGKLTLRNIFADSMSETHAEAELNKAIEKFLGGGEEADYVSRIEAETARRVAFRLFRLFLIADQEGYELLEDPERVDPKDPFKGLEIVFENAPGASDFGKLTHPDIYAGKSQRKGRDYLPPYAFLRSREYYKRFMVDFLRHGVAPEQIDVLIDNTPTQIIEDRSLMEKWWGYRGVSINPVTREMVKRGDFWVESKGAGEVTITYKDEPAFRLGDLAWVKYKSATEIDKDVSELLKPQLLEPKKLGSKEALEGVPIGGYHHEAFKSLWLTGFMFGGQDRANAIVTETNHSPQNLTDIGWWRKFWKMLDVGVKDGIAVNGVMRGMDKAGVKKAKDELKVSIVKNFIIGLQGLPQWEEWRIKEVEYYPLGGTNKEKPSISQRILEVANRALTEEGVDFRVAGLQDLLDGKVETKKK